MESFERLSNSLESSTHGLSQPQAHPIQPIMSSRSARIEMFLQINRAADTIPDTDAETLRSFLTEKVGVDVDSIIGVTGLFQRNGLI